MPDEDRVGPQRRPRIHGSWSVLPGVARGRPVGRALLHWRRAGERGEGGRMTRRRPLRSLGVPRSAFRGFRFPPEVIVLAVRWYLRYGLSYRDLEELLVERGVEVDHVTLCRWVQRFTPLLIDAARPCRH